MGNDVTVRMSAENAEMVRAWMESLRGPQAFQQELDKIAQKGQRAGAVTKSAMSEAGAEAGRMVSSLTWLGSALAVVSGLASMIKSEMEAWEARRKESGQAQVGVYEALQRAVGAHAGKDFNVDPDALLKKVTAGSKGVDPKDLLLTLEAGISSAGNLSQEDVLQTVMESANIAPEYTLARRQALVTGALELKKGFPEATPAQTLAGVKQSFVAARTEDVTDFAKNMAPGIKNMTPFGGDKDSYEYLASLAIGIGQRSGDATGRRSMNAIVTMLRQVKEETLSAGLVGPDASVEQQIEAVRKSPELQEKLLGVFAQGEFGDDWKAKLEAMRKHQKERGGDLGGDLHGEAKSFIAVVEALSPGDNRTKQEIASAREKIAGLNDEAVRQVQETRFAVAKSDVGKAGEAELLRKQLDNADLLNNPAGLKEKVLELNTKIRQAAGWGATERWAMEKTERFGNWMDPEGVPLDLDTSERQARAQAAMLRKHGRTGMDYHGRAGDLPTEEGNRRAENVEALADAIMQLREAIEKQGDKVQKVEVERKGAGAPLPAAPGLNDPQWLW